MSLTKTDSETSHSASEDSFSNKTRPSVTGGTGAGPVYDKSARESTRCEASANPAKPDRMSRKPKPIGKTANPIQLGIRQTQSDRGNGKSKEIGQSKSSDAQAGAAEVQRDCGAHRRVET
jgi:hypothetical protein